jgi:hypothetical protein
MVSVLNVDVETRERETGSAFGCVASAAHLTVAAGEWITAGTHAQLPRAG